MANTSDIFNRRPLTLGNSFAADSAAITFNSSPAGLLPGNGNGLLVQNMGFQYQQPVTRLYELGSQFTYYVVGRPQGNGTIGRILGPGGVLVAFYSSFGDACKAQSNVINLFVSAACGDPCEFTPLPNDLAGVRWCITGCLLISVGMTVAAQDMIMNESLGFMFVSLEICQTTQAPICWPTNSCCQPYSLHT